jgi:hypothetical protein
VSEYYTIGSTAVVSFLTEERDKVSGGALLREKNVTEDHSWGLVKGMPKIGLCYSLAYMCVQ